MPIVATTDLPGLSKIYLTSDGNSLIIEWDGSNYGEVEIQARPVGSTDWSLSQTTDFDGEPIRFDDLDSGTKYEVRGKTQTEHDESDWSDYESFVTLYLPIQDSEGGAVQSVASTGRANRESVVSATAIQETTTEVST